MVKVINQNIPADMLDAYEGSLHRSVQYLPGSGLYSVRHRVPFRLPHMKNSSHWSPSGAQRLVRAAFKKSCDCFSLQPHAPGNEDPALGPCTREYWYSQAAGSGLWYYDYFIQQTFPGFYSGPLPTWCFTHIFTPDPHYRFIYSDSGRPFSTLWSEMLTQWNAQPWATYANPEPEIVVTGTPAQGYLLAEHQRTRFLTSTLPDTVRIKYAYLYLYGKLTTDTIGYNYWVILDKDRNLITTFDPIDKDVYKEYFFPLPPSLIDPTQDTYIIIASHRVYYNQPIYPSPGGGTTLNDHILFQNLKLYIATY